MPATSLNVYRLGLLRKSTREHLFLWIYAAFSEEDAVERVRPLFEDCPTVQDEFCVIVQQAYQDHRWN